MCAVPQIRALTLFVKLENPVAELHSRVVDQVDRLNSLASYLSPWTRRIASSPIGDSHLEKYLKTLADVIGSLPRDILLQLIPVDHYRSESILKILNTLNEYPQLYASVKCDSAECIDAISRALLSFKGDYDVYTRFSITFGEWIQTPYFPSTAALKDGFSVALRYVDVFRDFLLRGDVRKVAEYVKEVIRKSIDAGSDTEIEFLGIDLSLSPWMDESVGELIEAMSGLRFGELGTLHTLVLVRDYLHELVSMFRHHIEGFNEIMLPVAEDNVLRKRALDGILRIRDLISYSFVCVVGLDLIGIDREESTVNRVLRDMLAVHRIKRRTIGVRIIPMTEDSIQIKRLGLVPKLQP